jgi:hypothetical protein
MLSAIRVPGIRRAPRRERRRPAEHDVAAVYHLAQDKYEMETRTFKDIGKGDNNRAKYEQTLRELGCEFES